MAAPPNPSPTNASFEQTYGVRLAWIQAFNVFGLLVVVAAVLGLMFVETHRLAFQILTSEHGVVELTTAVGFLVAALLSARIAWRARARGEAKWVGLIYAGFALFCFVCGMEELSWGQALLKFATPFGLRAVNEQGELNVHNLPGLMEMNDAFLLLFGVAGLVGVALGRSPRLRAIAPPRALLPMFAGIALFGALDLLTNLVMFPFSFAMIVGEAAEGVEMLGALASLVYVVLNGRMLEREARRPL